MRGAVARGADLTAAQSQKLSDLGRGLIIDDCHDQNSEGGAGNAGSEGVKRYADRRGEGDLGTSQATKGSHGWTICK